MSLTQSKNLRAGLGEDPDLISDIRNPREVHRVDAWDTTVRRFASAKLEPIEQFVKPLPVYRDYGNAHDLLLRCRNGL